MFYFIEKPKANQCHPRRICVKYFPLIGVGIGLAITSAFVIVKALSFSGYEAAKDQSITKAGKNEARSWEAGKGLV